MLLFHLILTVCYTFLYVLDFISFTFQTPLWSVGTIIILILQKKWRLREVKVFAAPAVSSRDEGQRRFSGPGTLDASASAGRCWLCLHLLRSKWDQQSQSCVSMSLMPSPERILIDHSYLRVSVSTCPLRPPFYIFPNQLGEVLQMMQQISVAVVGKRAHRQSHFLSAFRWSTAVRLDNAWASVSSVKRILCRICRCEDRPLEFSDVTNWSHHEDTVSARWVPAVSWALKICSRPLRG